MSPNMSILPVAFIAQLECPYCRNVYDRSKLVYNTFINQYICLDCHNNQTRQRDTQRIHNERSIQNDESDGIHIHSIVNV